MTFRVAITHFRLLDAPREASVNFFRGALGALLHEDATLYQAAFDPRWTDGPSGYRAAPRPFVLRYRPGVLDLITFHAELHSIIAGALSRTCRMEVASTGNFSLPTDGTEWSGLLKLRFVTPTALKESGEIASEPQFRVLFRRLIERIRALGRFYQQWSADVDFAELSQQADQIEMTQCEWISRSGDRRRSARSGHSHELRGYVGWAEYAGPVGCFVPLLEIGRYTGVGRNTVWGNGEIQIIESSVVEWKPV